MDSNFSIKLDSLAKRGLLVIGALLILGGVIYGFSWFFGDSIAANAQQAEVAAVAVSFAPADPAAYARLGALKNRSLNLADLPEAVGAYETAAALSPHDWRYWFALARTRERAGDAAGAEQAAKRAAELAPNYAQVRWLYGNVLLRRGASDAAFAEMRRAAEQDANLVAPFINAMLQVSKIEDVSQLERQIGEHPAARAALVNYLANNGKIEDALRVWQTLPEKEKQETFGNLTQILLNAKKYRVALPLFQAAARETEKPVVGQFINGGFEGEALDVVKSSNPFFWQIADGAQPVVAFTEANKRGGNRSLVIGFNSLNGQDFRAVSQLIAVEGATNYRFQLFAKTGAFKSGSLIFWEIADPVSGKILSKTAAVPTGDSDWQPLEASFVTAPETEAVVVRLARTVCNALPCMTTGRIWFDDFSLEKR